LNGAVAHVEHLARFFQPPPLIQTSAFATLNLRFEIH
jgi:hypothetical protein